MQHISICLALILLILPTNASQLRGRQWELESGDYSSIGRNKKKAAAVDDGAIPWGDQEIKIPSINGNDRTRIIGGQVGDVQPSFAMHLGIRDGGYHFVGCGGTLISNCHVLTAAHCVANERSGITNALYINAYKPSSDNGNNPYHFSLVKDVNVHPEYNNGDDTLNDVAIITLATCVDSNQDAGYFMSNLMRLADEDYLNRIKENKFVKVSGFGKLSPHASSYPDVIRSIEVPFIPNDLCKTNFHGSRLFKDEICAGGANGAKDSCQGDSGGPMFVVDGGVQYQLGIVSRGYGCAQPNSPGIYVSVAFHHDFIKNQVCGYSLSANSDVCTAPVRNAPFGQFLSRIGMTSAPALQVTANPISNPTADPTAAQSSSPSESPSSMPSSLQSKGPSCAGVCRNPLESLQNPYDTVTLPNGVFQFCLVIDRTYKELQGGSEICRMQSEQARNAGCFCR